MQESISSVLVIQYERTCLFSPTFQQTVSNFILCKGLQSSIVAANLLVSEIAYSFDICSNAVCKIVD